MAIGTSLGAYFEDEFHHQAGIDTPPEVMKPKKDTGDDNVAPPDPESQGREGDPKVLQVSSTSSTMPVGSPTEPAGALKQNPGTTLPDFTNDRPRDWVERLVTGMVTSAHDVGSGKVPMWAMDPTTGDYHTSPEGISAAQDLVPAANGGGFGRNLNIELQPEAHQALSEGPDVFQQFMATRGARQPSNIVDEPVSRYPEQDARMGFTPEQSRALDTQSGHDFEQRSELDDLGPQPGTMEHWQAEEARVRAEDLDRHERQNSFEQRPGLPERNPYRQEPWRDEDFHTDEPMDWHDRLNADIEENERAGSRFGKARMQEVKDQFTENPDAVKSKGNVSLMLDLDHEMNNSGHHYNFLSADGIPGELTVRMRDAGRDIHVAWIGTVGSAGPRDVGNSEMKNLFKLLAEQYPDAERVSGFRVSGARAEQGRIGDASMRIPGRKAPVTSE